MGKRLSDIWFDLRHPWWTFTREIALIHCQRTGQQLVRVDSPLQRIAVAAVQDTVVASVNALGAALIGSSYKPIESSPIPDDAVADMLSEVRKRQMLEECLPPGVHATPENMLRYYGIDT